MPFFKLSEAERRNIVKSQVESLEHWLRRVIDNKLTEIFGPQYWSVKDSNDSYLIKKEIREKVTDRLEKYPERFSRWIDASLLEHLMEIIHKDALYKNHFKPYFYLNYPLGREQLLFHLRKISEVRNRLYHSNPISIRQAEQTVCYVNDVIESIKAHYVSENKHMDFNAPQIISITDTHGNKVYRDKIETIGSSATLDLRETKFRSGEKLKVEIEVDASFDTSEYDIYWSIGLEKCSAFNNQTHIEIELNNKHVSSVLLVGVTIISKEDWHRYSYHDDAVVLLFTVLPPIK